MFNKKSLLLFVAASVAVLFAFPPPLHAQFKNDFLYKFQSRWSDIAVTPDTNRAFIINESYSRIEKYNTATATLSAIIGEFGTGNSQFNRPQGLAMDSGNTLYVLDSGNNRIVAYQVESGIMSSLIYLRKFGSSGTAAGQFNNPTGIATDGTYVYIADTDNNRVQRCTSDGVTCTVWGGLGTYDGKFSSPKGITYDNSQVPERVYVTDTGNNRIQWFDISGTYLGKFGSYGSGSSQFVLPYRIATESTAQFIFVLDTLNRIQRVSKANNLTDYTISLTTSGAGIAIASQKLYITSLPTTYQTYNTVITLGAGGTMTNDIGHPVDLSLDTGGNIYINNNFTLPNYPVVQKFNSSFVQQAEWHGNGEFGIGANGPLGFGMNSGNDWFVADTDSNLVQKFSGTTNTWAFTITGAPTPFVNPKDVATETTGKFYVADTGNSRIVKYDSGGSQVWSLSLPTVAAGTPTPPVGSTPEPYGITVASDNKIYVADAGYHRILRYHANDDGLNPEASWGQFGSADSSTYPQLDSPQGMAIDSAGNIYVADTGNNRIQRFDQDGTLATRVVWGTYGPQDGNFINPRNVFVDSSNRVYVSEVGELVGSVVRNRRIQVFGDATASAGLVITQTGGTTIAEGLTASSSSYLIDSYTVKLTTQPSTTVNVNLAVSDPTQASVSSPTLVFTPENWNIAQVVTVIPIHDFVSNGTRSVVISHKPTSSDIHYANPLAVTWSDVTVTINDTIDTPGITFSSNTVPYATEGATLSNAYSIVLNTMPAASVVVTLTPDSSVQVSPSSFTFTTADGNWNSPRQVAILPIRDYVAQGTHVGTIFHSSASTDPNYGPDVAFSDASGNVLVTISDPDTAGVSISESTVSVSESGTTDTYTVNLTSKPNNDVLVLLSDASPSAMVSMSPSTLTFTPSTWNPLVAQTVTVSAINDYLVNAINPRSTKILHTATSGDDTYQGINIASVSASITDSDTSGLLIFKQGGGSVAASEDGVTDSYVFQLTSIPTANVTVTLTSTDGQATTSAYLYTFTPSNWDTAQYATASAIDDALVEGDHNGIIIHTLSSTDLNFDGKTASQTVVITDNDAAGINIRLPNNVINLAEAGPSDIYYVRLNSQPTAPVLLNIGAQNQATASPGVLTFTSSNWSAEQEITITAIQDYVIEGAHTATVTYTGISSDTEYSDKTASFTANIADDDSLNPGVSIVETEGRTAVTKDGNTDTYTLSLTSKPSANVKIKIVADGPDATTSAGVYWFTPTVWNIPQTVTVSAKTSPAGGKTTIFTHLITSLDAHYNDFTPSPTVNVTVNENVAANAASAANAKPPVCSKTPPYNAPHLFQINTTQTEATLYFTPIKDNISYYFIAYGFTPGDLRFGTSFEMGSYDGVLDHTVSMLTPGTKYYFQIRGGNGCATGPWSSSVSATAVGSERSVQTVYTYYGQAASTVTSSGSSSGGSSTGGINLTRDLFPGSQGADVRSLQQYLNAKGFTLASSGAGSPGNETTYYGNLTTTAVRRFQEAHFQEILSPKGYSSGTGMCGPSTRSYINSHP